MVRFRGCRDPTATLDRPRPRPRRPIDLRPNRIFKPRIQKSFSYLSGAESSELKVIYLIRLRAELQDNLRSKRHNNSHISRAAEKCARGVFRRWASLM